MSRLNRKLDLSVISEEETQEIRSSHVSQSMGNMKSAISKLDLQIEAAPAKVPAPRAQAPVDEKQLAEVAIDVYRTNINPKKEKEEYEDNGPDTHASRVNSRSIQRALMGLRNGGDEGKTSYVGPNGSGNVGKYSPTAAGGSGNVTNNIDNYYALTTDMTLEQYEEYIQSKFNSEEVTEERKRPLNAYPANLRARTMGMSKDKRDEHFAKYDAENPPKKKEVKEEAQYLSQLKQELLQLEDTSWQSIDKVMRHIAKEHEITPKQLHKEFKAEHDGQIPDEWLKENFNVEMAGFVPLQELARLNPVGVIYNVTYMYRGGTQRQKFLVPFTEKPSQEQMEQYVRGFWPFARVIAYYPEPLDNQQNNNSLIAIPPVTENYYFYTPQDWVTLSEEDQFVYDTICEEEGEPLIAPEQQPDGSYLLLIADHDTGEHKYVQFGEGLTNDVRRQRGEDSPSNDQIRKQGAARDNAVAKLSQSDDFQKKMDAAIEKSIQRDKERQARRMRGEEYSLEEEKDKKGKGSGSKDACYHKVKARYDVWPSAYASGALVKCRQKGAKNWGNSKKKD